MPNCQDAIPLENLDFCPTVEIAAGVSEVGVYIASHFDFLTIQVPPALEVGTSLENIGTIATSHIFLEDRGFFRVYINPDSGLVDGAQVGEKGNLSIQNNFGFSLQGTGAKVVGLVRKYKNMPIIAIVKERDGNIKQIGSRLSPAYLLEVAPSSGSKAGDAKVTTFKFTDVQPYPAPIYAGTITEFPAPAPA